MHEYELRIPLDRQALADTCQWVKSLFPGAASWRWMRKVIPGTKDSIELQGAATDDEKDSNFGSVNFRLEPERRRGTHRRLAELQFYVQDGNLDYVNLGYTHGNRSLYLDWMEPGSEPPKSWTDFLTQGEALNRKYEADPTIERDVANIQNLDLFKIFAKSPLAKILGPLYEETIKRLFTTVEHEELHTDVGSYDEGLSFQQSLPENAPSWQVQTPPGTETIDLNPVPEEEIARAYEQWRDRGMPYRGSGYDRENYANFGYSEKTASGRTFNLVVNLRKSKNPLWKTDSLTSVSAHVNMSSAGYSLLRTGEIPVEPGPVIADTIAHPDTGAIDPELAGIFEKFWTDFIALWRPVEHHELHTDVGGYDESLDPEAREEFFRSLRPGDHFIYNYESKAPEEYVVVGILNNHISVRATSIESGRPGIFWHSDPKVVPVEIPEHEELHTDTGGYDESILKEAEPRKDWRSGFASIDLSWIKPEDFPEIEKQVRALGKKEWGFFSYNVPAFGAEYAGEDGLEMKFTVYLPGAVRTEGSFVLDAGLYDGRKVPVLIKDKSYFLTHVPAELHALNLERKPRIKRRCAEVYAKFISLFKPVEHEELHTDTGGYDEGLIYRRLAEEEVACRLTEGYDPSLDLGYDETNDNVPDEASDNVPESPAHSPDALNDDLLAETKAGCEEQLQYPEPAPNGIKNAFGWAKNNESRFYKIYQTSPNVLEVGFAANDESRAIWLIFVDVGARLQLRFNIPIPTYKGKTGAYEADNYNSGVVYITESATTFDEFLKEELERCRLFTTGSPSQKRIWKRNLRAVAGLNQEKNFPTIRWAYNEIVNRIFAMVPEHEELHTDIGGYDEARDNVHENRAHSRDTLNDILNGDTLSIDYDNVHENAAHSPAPTGPRIRITYQTITPESAEEGDYAERGWIDEEGHSCQPDEFDAEEGLEAIDLAVKFLRNEGARSEGSINSYEGEGDTNYETGAVTTQSYFLHGFTEEEMEIINTIMRGAPDPRPPPPPEHEELHTDVGSYDESNDNVPEKSAHSPVYLEARKPGPSFDYTVEAPPEAEKIDFSDLKIEDLPRIGAALSEAGFVKVRWHADTTRQTILWAYEKFAFPGLELSLRFAFKPEQKDVEIAHNFFSFDPSFTRKGNYQEFGELVTDIAEIPREYPAGRMPRLVKQFAPQLKESYRKYLDILSRFARVEHHELHTDTSTYDESLMQRLKEARELTGTVYHGGSYRPGDFGGALVLYTSPDKELAKSYVAMSKDRFGKGDLSTLKVTLRNAASEEVVFPLARRFGINPEEYTPASVFDVNLQDRGAVHNLVQTLERQGYDGAVLGDIAYGEEISGEAWIIFNPKSVAGITEAEGKGSQTTSIERIKEAFANLKKRFPVKIGQDLAGNWIEAPRRGLQSGTVSIVRDLPGTNRKAEGRITIFFDDFDSLPRIASVALTFYTDAARGLADAAGSVKEMPPFLEDLVKTVFIRPLVTSFEKSPIYPDLKEAYEILYEGLFPPPEHFELHTDVGSYDEAVEGERLDLSEICDNQHGYYRLAELLKQAGFKGVEVKQVAFSGRGAGDSTLRAYGETVHKETGKQFVVHFLIAPVTFTIRPEYLGPTQNYGHAKKEFVSRSFVVKNVPREIPYQYVVPSMGGMDFGVEYDPEEAIPEFRKLYELFLDVLTSPVAHEELHGDLSGYDESIGGQPLTPAQWDELEPGDTVYYRKRDTRETFDWRVIERRGNIGNKQLLRMTTITSEGKPMTATFSFDSAKPDGEWYPDLGIEHSELHTDTGAYDEAIEKDKNIQEALGLYTGPEFEMERWPKVIAELRRELATEITIREDNEENSRTVTALTEAENLVQFNRGALNGKQLIQTIVSCTTISPSMGVHVYGDEIKTGAEMPESIEALLDFHDAYYVGGPGEKQRGLGKPEPGERDLMLKALRTDPEYPTLEQFYEEFVSRLFSKVPEHEELHTDVGSYDESLSPRLTPEEWSNLRPGSVVVSTQGRYEILRAVANPNPGAEVKVNYLARSNPPAKNEPPEKHIFYSLGRWHLETVEHEELHTDVSGYDEGLHREIEKLTEAKEVIIDARALEAAIAWARETFRQTISMDHGPRRALTFHFCAPEDLFTTFKVKPSASVKFQFDRLSNGEEYLTSIIVRYIRPEAYRGGDLEIGIVDIVEGYPIPATWEELETEILHKYGPGTGAPRTMAPHKFMRAFRRLKFFPTIREAFEGFIERLFEPVGHEELHTDTGSYEEAAIDPASVRMADYELLRKYGRIPRESLPGLPASPSQNDAPGEEEA